MTKTSRYGLIVIGIMIFSFATPLILRYLSGVTKIGEETTSTGLFAVNTEPKEAQVFLDGKFVDNSPTNIQFLERGTYNITVKKEGFFDWHKDLRIVAGQVTWINPEPQKLYMFLRTPVRSEEAKTYTSFDSLDNQLVSLNGDELSFPFQERAAVRLNVDNISSSGFYQNQINIKTGSSTIVFNTSGQRVATLPAESYLSYVPAPNEVYYFLSSGNLMQSNSSGESSMVDTEVVAFGFYGQELYYLKRENNVVLYRYSLIDKNRSIISSNTPCVSDCKIFVSKNKKIFIQGLGDLYKYELQWKKVGGDVQRVYFDTEKPELTFVSRNEVSFYDFNIDKVWLIDRSNQGNIAEKEYLFRGDLGYLFISEGNRLTLLEIDRRGTQNKYYYEVDSPIWNFEVDSKGENIYIHTKDKITQLQVR